MMEHSAFAMFILFLRKVEIMKSINKIFLGAAVCLFMVVGILCINQIEANKKIEAYENQIQQLNAQINSQEEEINNLSTMLKVANQTLENQKPMVDDYMEISKFVDFDAIESPQLEKAREISEATPLDYESALVLVKYADMYDIPYSLVLAIIDVESNFTKDSVGSSQDRGYMQIIPVTEKYLATQFGDELGLTYDPERIFEPEYNLALGIKYLDELMNTYGANYDRILSAYNRGSGNLSKYYEAYKTYSTSYSRKVLNNETLYVALND